MLEVVKQWLAQNALWLGGALAAGSIIEWFFKPFRWAIPKISSFLKRSFTARGKQPRVTLHFVAMDFPQSHWGIGQYLDNANTCIVTRWHVTQAPESRMSVLLLKVHLLKPLAKYITHSNVVVTIGGYERTRQESEIPDGGTRNLIITCNLSKVLKPETRLKVYFAVEDQFANKHKLPPIMLKAVPIKK